MNKIGEKKKSELSLGTKKELRKDNIDMLGQNQKAKGQSKKSLPKDIKT